MKVTFLGTGTSQGVPVIGCNCSVCQSKDPKDQRLRTSIHLAVGDKSLVVDTGPDFRQQMLANGINRIDAILYTHEHKDHTAGLDDIRPINFLQKGPLKLFATERVQKAVKKSFDYIFEDSKYPGLPEVEFETIGEQPFEVAGIKVIPIDALHMYLPVKGFRFGDFTYITDANHIDPESIDQIKGSKVLVLNALKQEEHYSHFNLEQALKWVDYFQPEAAYFTHIAHEMGQHEGVEAQLPDHVHLAYDGLTIEIS